MINHLNCLYNYNSKFYNNSNNFNKIKAILINKIKIKLKSIINNKELKIKINKLQMNYNRSKMYY